MTIDVANRLVALRRERGLSQEELAAQLGVSRQAVSKWERAESSPDTDNLIALARLYNLSLDELLLHTPAGQGGSPGTQAEPTETVSAQEEEIFAAARAWDEAEAAYAKERRKQWKRRREKLLLPLTLALMVVLPLLGIGLRLGNEYAVVVSAVYLITGFALDNWHPGWMLYLTIPLYYGIWERLV